MRRAIPWYPGIPSLILVGFLATTVRGAAPSVEQALKLLPMQQEVDFSRPTAQQTDQCTIQSRKVDGHSGWIVKDPDGLVLRRFADTNGDNVVDQWSYYKDGLEVYRDIDTDFNGKADQYRWLQTGGSRWGLDRDEDGRIDAWKTISAEEVTAEVVAALARRDAARFGRLILTPKELDSLGLGQQKAAEVAKKTAELASEFELLAAQHGGVTPETQWVQFSGSVPGVVPAGTDGSTKDLKVYESVIAFVESGESHGQVRIGTLVEVGDLWRVIDLPGVDSEDQANLGGSGFFFQASIVRPGGSADLDTGDEGQRLLGELEQLDQSFGQAATAEQQAALNARRADLVRKIARTAATAEDRAMWLRQLADMVSAAVQSGTFPDGVERLEALFKELDSRPADRDLAAYVKFRQLTAGYAVSLQAPRADFAKIQTQWLDDLQQYVADYPTSPDAAEAMLQMAISQEFAGEEDEAKQWYGRVVQTFPDSPAAKKAAGARIRLDSVGKRITLRGHSPTGETVDLASYRGRVVLIQYWATWCEPAKRDMAVLKELATKYRGSLAVVGVSLDSVRENLDAYLAENRLPWPQIFEEGGLDSDPANQLGILTLPTMILLDKQGIVVDRNIQAADLENELKKLIR